MADIQEILNYRAALREAVNAMRSLPLSQRVIRQAHFVLMQGVRGEGKAPGEYRRVPNWIGPPGSTIEEARFVPAGAEAVPGAMSEWERYLHSDAPDVLVQLSVLHAEFEAIHPFLDGNGRLGRLVVPLFLVEKRVLSSPSFYISAFLERNRDEYYDRLLAVSRDNDWTGWCSFFLRAIRQQAEANQQTALAILKLYRDKKDWIVAITRSPHAVHALDWFFSRPVFSASDFMQNAGIPKPTAARIVRHVRDNGMLLEIRPSSGRRASVYAFPELLELTEGSGPLVSHL